MKLQLFTATHLLGLGLGIIAKGHLEMNPINLK